MLCFLRCLAFLLVLTCACPLLADEPKQKAQKPEPVPAPNVLVPGTIVIEPYLPKPGTREIWQYYGVDGRGRFLPRVMYNNSSYFYLRTGEPYPWGNSRPLLFMPYAY